MQKICSIFFWALLLTGSTSCRIEVNLGLQSNYKKALAEAPFLFQQDVSSTCTCCANSTTAQPAVVKVTGKEINQCLAKEDKAIVYIWAPHCRSDFCYSLDLLQEACDKRGVALFVVAEYYDSKMMGRQYKLSRPLYGIDAKVYKSNFSPVYLSRFLSELTGIARDKSTTQLVFFQKGEFAGKFNQVEEIDAYLDR